MPSVVPVKFHHLSARGSRIPAGFSLVEMLTAVAIIGVVSFLAIPNFVRMREDSERDMAIARAESLTVAMATMIKTKGLGQAVSEWNSASNVQNKYAKLLPYLVFADNTLTNYIPTGYTVTFSTIDPLIKPTLKQGSKVVKY